MNPLKPGFFFRNLNTFRRIWRLYGHKQYFMRKLYLPVFALLGGLCSARAQNHADCVTAMRICKKQVYHIDRAAGEGDDATEAAFVPCFLNGESMGQAEENSTWIAFEIDRGGTLTFTIVPHREEDDIDFVVYRLPPNGDCRYKQIVRCMAAGDSRANAQTSPCMGPTGLREGEKDTSEDAGCSDAGDNNWLAPLSTAAGEKYVILISNVTSRGPGFSISFGGSAKLPCDEDPPQKPARETPKPKPTPAPPPPVAEASPPVTAIEGRDVEVKEKVKVKSRSIKLRIWDSQIEDGDVVSIYVNDKKVISNLYLTNNPKEFDIELPAGREHLITVYAEDFGKAEPNTARVVIYDGTREHVIDLVAERKKQQSIKILVE